MSDLLKDLRVLEFGQVAAGPFAGSLLAEMGADVVKVERPGTGDPMRAWPPFRGEMSENFASINKNKRSIALDIKSAKDRKTLHDLFHQTDVVIENFRPGVLESHDLGYATANKLNPRIVYCSISGYGQTGPYAKKGAFDVTVQAISGLMSVTGFPGEPPVKCGVPVGDFVTGLYAAFTISAAVNHARSTNQGRWLDVSMLGSLLGVSALQTSEYFGTDKAPQPLGTAHPRNAPYQAFEASDTYFVIAAGNDQLWYEVCDLVGMPKLKQDPRFVSVADRAKNQDQIFAILQPVFKTKSVAEWLLELDRCGVPCAPINTFADILTDEHVRQNKMVRPLPLPSGDVSKTTIFPVEGVGKPRTDPPPLLGAHTDAVIHEWLGTSARQF